MMAKAGAEGDLRFRLTSRPRRLKIVGLNALRYARKRRLQSFNQCPDLVAEVSHRPSSVFAIHFLSLRRNRMYTAVITGFLISAMGGSRVQIGGPTGAFCRSGAGIVAKHCVDGLFMCTIMGVYC